MDRTAQPPFQKSLAFNLQTPERIPLSGELQEICYLPSSLNQAVKIEFVFEAGRYFEPMNGLAQFTVQMLSKGIHGKDSNQIASLLDYHGAHIECHAGMDFASVSLITLKKNVKKLLPLFLSIVSAPTFPEKELDNYREIFVENLKVNLEKNTFIASNQIRKNIYGQHPYGKSVQPKDPNKITTSDLQLFFKEGFQPFKIFIVGEIESSDMDSLTQNIQSTATTRVRKKANLSFESLPATDEKFQGPNKIQASIQLAQKTITRNHPDFPDLLLVNHILGGFFGSRLMKNIREEKGLTYGIHSSIQNLMEAATLSISADVNATESEGALNEIKKEIASMANISEAEIDIAKNHLIGSYQNDVNTIFAAGEKIKTMVLFNLSLDYYQNLINQLSKIDSNSLQIACTKYLNANSFASVVVQ